MQNLTLKKKLLGQGMTEYIIIVALIAIAAIGVFKMFGQTARSQMAGMSLELSGKNGTEAIAAAGKAADKAKEEGEDNKNLGKYSGGNEVTAKK